MRVEFVAALFCFIIVMARSEPKGHGCAYVTKEGEVKQAKVGEGWFDGCNGCVCRKYGAVFGPLYVAECTERYCPKEEVYTCEYVTKRGKVKQAKVGESYYDGCNTCVCRKNGAVCTMRYCPKPKVASCKYVTERGKVRRAKEGEGYSDGCNRCLCGKNGGACSLMACPHLCKYTHWSKAVAYAKAGHKRMLKVYDARNDCRQKCKCAKGKEGPMLNCTKRCDRKGRRSKGKSKRNKRKFKRNKRKSKRDAKKNY
jgi:hypothetical protein